MLLGVIKLSKAVYNYPDGATYKGDWLNNKRHGYGFWMRPDGTRYEGEWANDKPNGRGTLISKDGRKYSGEWLNGRRNGLGTMIYPDGRKQSGIWSAGKLIEEKDDIKDIIAPCAELEEENLELQYKLEQLEKESVRDERRSSKRQRGISFAHLKRFNLVMGFLHLVQGSLMLFFALTVDQISNFKTPVWSYFLEFDTIAMRLVTRPEMLAEVPFAIFVSFFLFLSALAHFIIVSPKANRIYVEDLKKGINKFRWYEYSLSSSLMIILIAMLFGVYDIGSLIVIFILNASMNWFGLLMERLNQYTEKVVWSPFVFGSIAGIGPWVVIVMHALGNADPAEVPWFVYAILGSYFIFFNLFPINMVLQYKKVGKWADYLYGERGYIILSLVAKSVLAWLVYFGVMQPV